MGGMKDGRLASETAIQSLRQSFQAMDRSQDLAPQLERSVFQASAQVEALIGELKASSQKGMKMNLLSPSSMTSPFWSSVGTKMGSSLM